MSEITDWRDRLKKTLEPGLCQADPRPHISAYHDMPYAIFRYPPEDEFALRQEVALLTIRLEQIGKRVTKVSLAECMYAALEAEGLGAEALIQAEKSVGLIPTIETVHQVLSEYRPLDELVASRIPADADRCGILSSSFAPGPCSPFTAHRLCSSSSRVKCTYQRFFSTQVTWKAQQGCVSWDSRRRTQLSAEDFLR